MRERARFIAVICALSSFSRQRASQRRDFNEAPRARARQWIFTYDVNNDAISSIPNIERERERAQAFACLYGTPDDTNASIVRKAQAKSRP